MKLDTSKPKDWRTFVDSLDISGLEKLLLKHCEIEVWEFPTIILTIEIDEKPVITLERVESLRIVLANYYECDKVSLKIFPKMPGTRFYTSEGYVKHVKDNNLREIEKRIELKKHSENMYLAKCPFHEEKTPSFSVHVLKNMYHCFGCGTHGELGDFAKEFDEFHAGKKKENREKCIKHLKFARIRCREIMNNIDYQIVNYYHPYDDVIDLSEIRDDLDQLIEDIESAEDC